MGRKTLMASTLDRADEVRGKLNLVLDAHSRNLQTATKALARDAGHHCDCRKALEAIMNRSYDAIKIKA